MGTIDRSGKAPQPTGAANGALSLFKPTTPKPEKSVALYRDLPGATKDSLKDLPAFTYEGDTVQQRRG